MPLQDDVREKKREGDAHPHNRFVNSGTAIFPAHHTGNEANFKKYDGYGEAARHPLPMLLDFAVQNEIYGNGSG